MTDTNEPMQATSATSAQATSATSATQEPTAEATESIAADTQELMFEYEDIKIPVKSKQDLEKLIELRKELKKLKKDYAQLHEQFSELQLRSRLLAAGADERYLPELVAYLNKQQLTDDELKHYLTSKGFVKKSALLSRLTNTAAQTPQRAQPPRDAIRNGLAKWLTK